MKNLIAGDIARCAGDNCPIRDTCKRYLQSEIDNKRDDLSYHWYLLGELIDGNCENYLKNE